MTEMAVVDIQSKVTQALKQMSAAELETSVRTHKLAKRLKLLGVKMTLSEIAVELTKIAPSQFGKKFATFVGGTSDPLDQYIWTLPKQE
jgi:hypothetical protein